LKQISTNNQERQADLVADQKKKTGPTLHGNQAKIDASNKNPLFCHSYEAKTAPQTFDFESLPGSKADLKNARNEFKSEKTNP
jgi:hypothetical protein